MKHKFIAKKNWNDEVNPLGKVVDMLSKYDDIIDLSIGDPDYITDINVINAAFEDAKNGHTRYTDPLGQLELREELVKYYKDVYNYELNTKEVMAVVGASHGMYLVMQAILDEGDEVIIHEPCFSSYTHQIKLAGGKTISLETLEEEGFMINAQKLESLITSKTKAIIINTPNNPTGACFDRKTLEGIAKIAIDKDLIIIVDDVYGSFSFNEPYTPITTFEGVRERTITIGSFSKDYAMTGWRIGYIAAPDFIINCVKEINENLCYSAPTISQRAALHALRMRDVIQPPMIEEYKKRIFYTYERVNKIPNMSVMVPRGTFYMFINIKNTGLTCDEVVERILEEAHVLVIPGNAFGKSGEGYIRIATTVGVDELKIAFDRICKMNIFSSKVYK